MLQKIEIDGFRSLLNFELALQPGLNVIVGANGSGKSNFVTFLDFLGALIDGDLNSAIAVAQGAGSMFSKERFAGDTSVELSFKLSGLLDQRDPDDMAYLPFPDNEIKKVAGPYSYSCTITYLSSLPAVYISHEQLTVTPDGTSEMQVSRTTTREESVFKNRVTLLPEDHKLNRVILRYIRKSENKSDVGELLAKRVTPERSILSYISHDAPAFALVVNDLTKYRSVNIDPNVARRPSPVGSVTSLRSNGEGLAGALYQLRNGIYFPGRGYNRFFPVRGLGEPAFKSIISWCREVNPAIEDVLVKLDVMEAQLRPSMAFRHSLSSDIYPLNRISDGTVKWLALTTILFAEPGLSIIEEPENFLHPFMQESFVELCRQALLKDPLRSLIISTHSPTLLDCCKPSELTMFELCEGSSRASRIANREELTRKLQASRFGLGYYYKIGALHGEDSSNC